MQPDNNLTPGPDSSSGSTPSEPSTSSQPGSVVGPQPGQSFVPQPTSPQPNAGVPTSPETPSVPPAPVESPASTATSPPLVSAPPQQAGQTPVGPSFNQQQVKSKNKKVLKLVAVVVVALLLIGGSSAAAYFGYVVPNKPENILKQAFENTLKQKQINYDGNITLDPANPKAKDAIPSFKLTMKGQSDADKHAASGEFKVTVNGIDVSFEVRLIDQNLYFKLGDVATHKAILTPYLGDYPGFTAAFDVTSKHFSNQWVEVDSTLLKQAGSSCALDISTSFSDSDIQLLEDQFKNSPFITVDSNSGDTVSGKPAQKYQLTLDNKKGAKYVSGLKNLSLVKKLDECSSGAASSELDRTGDAEDMKIPLTIWVDKSTKRIVKVGYTSTKQDADRDNLKGVMQVTLNYGVVNVTAPEGAKPALQVISEWQADLQKQAPELSQLLGGGLSGDLNSVESL
jgi:hypothetical protein